MKKNKKGKVKALISKSTHTVQSTTNGKDVTSSVTKENTRKRRRRKKVTPLHTLQVPLVKTKQTRNKKESTLLLLFVRKEKLHFTLKLI